MMRLGPWRIGYTLGRDLCSTYYSGRRDDGERSTLCLVSRELATERRRALTELVELHRGLDHPGLIRFRGIDDDGGDCYLIADAVDDALASLRRGCRPTPAQAGPFGAALAAALVTAHDRDLFHGGLDLDNVLWAPGRAPQILGAGLGALGAGDRAALARVDVAALGRLLCALIAGRQPVGADEAGRAAYGRLGELVGRLAELGTATSMRGAHAMLAEGEPTQIMRSSGEATTVDELRYALDAGESVGLASPAPEPLAGHVGRYRILTRVGRGGMGEVFLAEDPALRRGVAIKRIRPGLEHDHGFRVRLRREAQLTAQLGHRAIVQVFDLVTDDSADHVVMEYVSGSSLHALAGGNALHVSEVLRIAAELADGLAYAHQHGVIHRDLKLENILIGTDHQPKIADFGLAYCVATTGHADDDESLTGDGLTVGTSRAMSPEQARGQEVDARSDLFSLGVMLYELVTGASPFASDSRLQTILRVLHHRQPSAHELAPGVPRSLSDLIDQLLEKDPGQRPDNALIVRDRLRNLAAGPEPSPAPQPAPAACHTDVAAARGGADDDLTPAATFDAARRFRTGAAGDGWLPSALAGLVKTELPLAHPPGSRMAVTSGRNMTGTRLGSGTGGHDCPVMPDDSGVELLPGSTESARLPNLRAMVIAFAAALGAGVLQLLIAWSAGVALDGRAQGDTPRIFIGYLSSYHWWVSHMVLVPVAVACALPTWSGFTESRTRRARIVRTIVVAIACLSAAAGVISEVLRVINRVPLEACQWNYMHCQPEDGAYSPVLRAVLLVLGYLHELLGYGGLMFTVIGVLALAWLRHGASAPATSAPATSSHIAALLLNQRLCMVGYCGYLLLLRSSKVGSYLAINDKSYEQITIVGMFSRWGTYFNLITYGMGWALFLGGTWILMTLASHLLVAHTNIRRTLSDDTYGIWSLVTEAARIAGGPFLGFILGAIVFIVLPPPGWPPLVAVGVAAIGIVFLRGDPLRRAREERSPPQRCRLR